MSLCCASLALPGGCPAHTTIIPRSLLRRTQHPIAAGAIRTGRDGPPLIVIIGHTLGFARWALIWMPCWSCWSAGHRHWLRLHEHHQQLRLPVLILSQSAPIKIGIGDVIESTVTLAQLSILVRGDNFAKIRSHAGGYSQRHLLSSVVINWFPLDDRRIRLDFECMFPTVPIPLRQDDSRHW